MSLMEFLTWMEVNEANEKLEEQNRLLDEANARQADRERREKIEKEEQSRRRIAAILETLYRSGESAVPSHEIGSLNDYIYRKFLQSHNFGKRCFRYTENPHTRLFFLVAAFIFLLWLVPGMQHGTAFYNGFVAIVFLTVVVKTITYFQAVEQQDRYRKEIEECRADNLKRIRKLKEQFPNLTPYGMFLKSYIDRSIGSTLGVMTVRYPEADTGEIVRRLYRLFDMEASAEFDYDNEIIDNITGDLAKVFVEYEPSAAG